MTLELLFPALILIGLTIILVYGWLLHRAKQAEQTLLALIQLNELHHFDLINFLEHSWDLLKDTGLEGYTWELHWFDNHLEGQCGNSAPQQQTHTLSTPEASLKICLYHRRRRGNRLADGSLWQTFLLLLRMDLWMKLGIVNTTQAHMDKLSLFLAHDMKNIAQYLQLTTDQLLSNESQQSDKLLTRLRQSFPVMRRRAENILRTLNHTTLPADPGTPYSLRTVLEEACAFHGLNAHISGDQDTRCPLRTIEAIVDNLLKNYADASHAHPDTTTLEIQIDTHPPCTRVRLHRLNGEATDSPTHSVRIDRFFEPLLTTNPQGNGIGLYQARHMARSLGGELRAEYLPNGNLQFEWLLPADETTPGPHTV